MLGLSLASPSNTLLTASKPISANPKSSSSSYSIHGIPIKNVSFLRMPSSPSSLLSSSSSTSLSSSSIVMMAKQQQELDEIRSKTEEELTEEVIDLDGELQMLALLKSTRKEYIPSEFRRIRKRIARILTVRRERELEQGIKKRYSRKLDNKWVKTLVTRPPPSLRKMMAEEAAADAAKKAKESST